MNKQAKRWSSIEIGSKGSVKDSRSSSTRHQSNAHLHNNPERRELIEKIKKELHRGEINMQTMYDANKEYLEEMLDVKDIPKPHKYQHKIPSKTPNSTYNKQFHKEDISKLKMMKMERRDNLMNGKKPVSGYQSLYGSNFNQSEKLLQKEVANESKKPNTPSKQIKTQYKPSDAPTFYDTSYGFNFASNYHPIPAQSAKRREVKLMGGGSFKADSTYHGVFKPHSCSKKEKPIVHNNNKLFMTIVAPKQSTYREVFNTAAQNDKKRSHSVKTESTNKGTQKSQKTVKTLDNPNKYNTEYKRTFQSSKSEKRPSETEKLMTLDDMKRLILNVL